MIEHYFHQPAVLRRMRGGIMSPYLDALAAELEAQHYSRKSIRRQLRNGDAFGRWLAEQQIPLANISEAVVTRYTEPMRRCPSSSRAQGYRSHNSRGLSRLIELLCCQGVMSAQEAAVLSPPNEAEHWLQVFDQHLERVAGVGKVSSGAGEGWYAEPCSAIAMRSAYSPARCLSLIIPQRELHNASYPIERRRG